MANTEDHEKGPIHGENANYQANYRRGARLGLTLTVPFLIIYFVAAIITTRELAGIAAISIGGLPLGFYVGLMVIVAGVVAARLFLVLDVPGLGRKENQDKAEADQAEGDGGMNHG